MGPGRLNVTDESVPKVTASPTTYIADSRTNVVLPPGGTCASGALLLAARTKSSASGVTETTFSSHVYLTVAS